MCHSSSEIVFEGDKEQINQVQESQRHPLPSQRRSQAGRDRPPSPLHYVVNYAPDAASQELQRPNSHQ